VQVYPERKSKDSIPVLGTKILDPRQFFDNIFPKYYYSNRMITKEAPPPIGDPRLNSALEIRGIVSAIDKAFVRPTSENIQLAMEAQAQLPDKLATYWSLKPTREHAADSLLMEYDSLHKQLGGKSHPYEAVFTVDEQLLLASGMDSRLVAVLFEKNKGPNGKAKIQVKLSSYGTSQDLQLLNKAAGQGVFIHFSDSTFSASFSVGTTSHSRDTKTLEDAERFIDRGFRKENQSDTISRHYLIGNSIIKATQALVNTSHP
jgi:hypothetical protein